MSAHRAAQVVYIFHEVNSTHICKVKFMFSILSILKISHALQWKVVRMCKDQYRYHHNSTYRRHKFIHLMKSIFTWTKTRLSKFFELHELLPFNSWDSKDAHSCAGISWTFTETVNRALDGHHLVWDLVFVMDANMWLTAIFRSVVHGSVMDIWLKNVNDID